MFGQQGQSTQQGTFSFGTPSTKTTVPATFGTNTSTSFGAGFGGFSFGAGTVPSAAVAGTKPTAAPGTGFSLGAATATAALPKSSFSFGQTTTTAAPAPGSQPAAPGGFSFGGIGSFAAPTGSFAAPTGSFAAPTGSFAAPTGSFAAPTGSFAAPTSKPTGTATTFPFASTSQPQAPKQLPSTQPIVFGQAPTQVAAAPSTGGIAQGFSLQKTASVSATTTTVASSGFGFTGLTQPFPSSSITTAKVLPTATTLAQSGLAIGVPALTSTSGFKLGGITTTTASATASTGAASGLSTGFSFGGTSTATAATSLAGAVVKPLTSTAPAGVAKPTGAPLSYKQLEDLVNKWVHELEDQERMFLNQASQVNTWDRLLIENGEKITELHSEVERVKSEQKTLDRELDFILSQQQELEEILQPLEEQLKSQQGMQYLQHADLEREKTYKMAENVDGQLKRMTQDLREVIEHINCSNVNTRETEDPMTQIARILNAHMDSLQWVDQNTALVQRRVEDVNKQMEARKRDHERTVRLSFD